MAETTQPASTCAVAVVVTTIPTSVRERLGLTPRVLSVWDYCIQAAAVLGDDTDPRPVTERIEALRASLPDIDHKALTQGLADLETTVQRHSQTWSRYIRQHGSHAFLRRILGEGTYRALVLAFFQDVGVLTVVARRAVRHLMPYAVAIDDLTGIVNSGQLTRLSSPLPAELVFLDMALKADEFMDAVLTREDLRDVLALRPEEQQALGTAKLVDLTETLRDVVAGRARESVVDLSRTLTKKVDGARVALESSPDGVSQAANSLVELIDRLLRQAFSEQEVLTWCAANYADWPEVTYVDANAGDRVRPSKLGQALCFGYAGREVGDRSVLVELTALALREARARLQRLKHADSEEPEAAEADRVQVRRALAAVEAYLHLSLSITWVRKGDVELQGLRQRLAS